MSTIMIFNKMNNFVKKSWVKALRSGKYKQGKGQLCDLDKCEYCCLGVLTDIYCKTHKLNEEKRIYLFNGNTYLDDDIKKCYGLTFEIQEFLARKNDGHNKKRAWTFNEIADWIEENL